MVSERLVEEAAKAIREVRWSHALPHSIPGGANWTDKDLARAALAVFEAAQAPTGDEREELIGLQLASYSKRMSDGYTSSIIRSNEEAAEIVLDAGFRLPVQGEPTEDGREAVLREEFAYRIRTAVAYGAMRHYRDIPSEVRADWIQGEISKAMSVLRTRVLVGSGEPTDATCRHDWQNRVGGGSKCTNCDLWQDKRVPPQGEPTDAQVLAALNNYEAWSAEETLDMWGTDQVARMRAALRAAGVTAVQGGQVVPCARCGENLVVAADALNSDLDVCGRCGVEIGATEAAEQREVEWEYTAEDDRHRRFTDDPAVVGKWRSRGMSIRRRTKQVPAGPWLPVEQEDNPGKSGEMFPGTHASLDKLTIRGEEGA